MSLEIWFAFAAASLVLLIIPGPTVVLTISYALSHGRKTALGVALGVALGDFLAMSASLAGLGALVMASATLFVVLKWIGAVYLIWLGVNLWRSPDGLVTPADTRMRTADRSIFWHAATVTALNPKSLTFFIAFVPQFLNESAPFWPQCIVMVATFVTLATLNALVYALAANQAREKLLSPVFSRFSKRAGGTALIGMGAVTATLERG